MDKTQSTKTIKDFEEKLNINPEFFGLFREELLNMNTENINFETTEDNPKPNQNLNNISNESNKPLTINPFDISNQSTIKNNNENNNENKSKSKSKSKSKVKTNSKKEKIPKKINIINDISQDDLNTKIELENKNYKQNFSSTTVCLDDLKNLKLDKYQMHKLEEIIKYFYLYDNSK